MTLSSATPDKRRTLLGRLAAIEDGVILRLAFFAMLAGTTAILVLDYRTLNADRPVTETGHGGNPVLPAVERPEIDPDNPAFRPHERISTPHEILSAPLAVRLVAGGVLELTGTIGVGAATQIADEIAERGSYISTIALDSPGGSVEDALAIARMVREAGYATHVPSGALCASSCPLILAAGSERIVDPLASVGVHQIYAAAGDIAGLGTAQAMSDAQAVTARISRHLSQSGVDPAVWVHAMETPPNRLYYLTGDELVAYRLATATTF